MSPTRSMFLVAVGLFLALGPRAGLAETVTVACAASLQDPVREASGAFEEEHPEISVHVSTGASSLLARQIDRGAPIDLFVSADDRTIAWLSARGRIDSTSVAAIAGNRIVVVAPADRVPEIDAPADLAAPRIDRVALCAEIVPIGRYAAAFLETNGLRDRLEGRIVRTDNVRATLAAAAAGAVDLAFVYATDAATTRAVRIVWRVDPA
ncbi:MAG: molybdate ABC transporter substrate-binding protein, partial [Candidatus Eisenbacteria bacterium]|nr:molybdate ABC transporter substrate-binding protein [Candidatus Latescibacterota bacterium]MBD3302008.1 molybdate ABC transporter substrate-binding protein [Candidatus Eisenbacteria bacterium]